MTRANDGGGRGNCAAQGWRRRTSGAAGDGAAGSLGEHLFERIDAPLQHVALHAFGKHGGCPCCCNRCNQALDGSRAGDGRERACTGAVQLDHATAFMQRFLAIVERGWAKGRAARRLGYAEPQGWKAAGWVALLTATHYLNFSDKCAEEPESIHETPIWRARTHHRKPCMERRGGNPSCIVHTQRSEQHRKQRAARSTLPNHSTLPALSTAAAPSQCGHDSW